MYALVCPNKSMPLVVDCSPNTKCRSNLVLWLCPTRAAFNDGSRCNLTLSAVLRALWVSHIEIELRFLRQSWCFQLSCQRICHCLLSQLASLLVQLSRLLLYVALLAPSPN